MLASTLLISPAPKPVKTRLCLGRENSGPIGPLSSEIGALVDSLRSRVVVDAMLAKSGEIEGELQFFQVERVDFEHLSPDRDVSKMLAGIMASGWVDSSW